ncbi:MAG: LysR family transcriptional regulator [Sinimarinibacterium flocculans]|uniref:LysR family transcriptional regulator n=1 Tax=Sinimarinibacterium flocculans TaxID=985250 RepID=UPI003C62A3B4
MDLNKVDLNLLLVFNQLVIERRVSRVAESLGVSQPAVSNALNRLRKLLNDDLFLRTSHGMEPTPRALQLAEPIAYAIDTIKSALSQESVFEPATSTRSFTIAATDIGEIYFLPPLLNRLAEMAPGVTLSTIRHNPANLKDDMESGRADFAIGLLPQLQGSFFRQRLFRQRFVCVFRNQHPLAKRKIVSKEDFYSAKHAVVVLHGTGHGEIDKLIDRKGAERRIQLSVPHFVAMGHILQETDLIATLPERLAKRLEGPFKLTCVPHPVKLPDHSIDLFWHAKLHRDPANQWLRRLMFELFTV